jgi:hypothetical protein
MSRVGAQSERTIRLSLACRNTRLYTGLRLNSEGHIQCSMISHKLQAPFPSLFSANPKIDILVSHHSGGSASVCAPRVSIPTLRSYLKLKLKPLRWKLVRLAVMRSIFFLAAIAAPLIALAEPGDSTLPEVVRRLPGPSLRARSGIDPSTISKECQPQCTAIIKTLDVCTPFFPHPIHLTKAPLPIFLVPSTLVGL